MFITDPLIWIDAKHQCEYQGGKLASIQTDSVRGGTNSFTFIQ